MAKIRALSPEQAKRTLVQRLSPLTDRLRQIPVNMGTRPIRCFLVWTRWSGQEAGSGTESVFHKTEILPTPRVRSLDRISITLFAAGTLPVGSVVVDLISASLFTTDNLLGHAIPGMNPAKRNNGNAPLPDPGAAALGELPVPGTEFDRILEPMDFYWELVEDGRGDNPAWRSKFRPASIPHRDACCIHHTLILERVGQDNLRNGQSAIGLGVR